MCGICGKVYFDHEHAVTRQELLKMSTTLIHRGPDGEGVWAAGNVGLAHRRLAIIDLRTVAGQPMSNEDGSVWITFNGEIYNFRELRTDLEARGHVFRTASDTEVIVHAYEEYGRQCLDRLRGMFAFAIWDARKRLLFLARDRVGKKPLFYYPGRDQFLFASEIKALLADRTVPAEPDPVALDHFLALQYIPAPLTAFAVSGNFHQRTGSKSVMAISKWDATGNSVHPQTPGHPGGSCGRITLALCRSSPPASCQRCPARRFSQWGRRFKRHSSRHGSRNGAPGTDVFGGIRRCVIGSAPICWTGSGTLRDHPYRTGGKGSGNGYSAASGMAL